MYYYIHLYNYFFPHTDLSIMQSFLRIEVNLLKPTGCLMHQQFNIQQFTFLTHCIYVFCIYLRTNSDLCQL